MIGDLDLQLSIVFAIKEADSVHQPKVDSNINIQDINDDCLLHITSYLDLVDIVNLGQTSISMHSFVQQIYRRKPHFSFGTNTGDSTINELNMPIILQEIGGHIRSIEWQHLNSSHLDVLSKNCPNVISLELTSPLNKVNTSSVKKNKKLFRNLQTLDIKGASFFDVTFKTIISSSPKLRCLQISECRNIRGKFFSKWKSSKMKCLNVTDNPRIGCENVHQFLRNNKLTKFTFDAGCSFGQCLSAPPECLVMLKELKLDCSSLSDEKLKILQFENLKRLTDLTLTRKHAQMGSCNNILAAMSPVKTLKSLTIHNIEIDNDTVKQLGLFQKLQKMNFNDCLNRIGEELYSSIPTHLANLTTLSMLKKYQINEDIGIKSISDMILSLKKLKYFSHSSMTWELLDMILKVQLIRQPSTIEIGVSSLLWNHPKKKFFMVNLIMPYNIIKSISGRAI